MPSNTNIYLIYPVTNINLMDIPTTINQDNESVI